MAASPLVSVIIPCFNAGKMLEPCLWSVFAQAYPDLEVIVVDNNSTDGSLDRARAFAAGKDRPFQAIQCPAQGANHARNAGYALARGDYVQWLDADDALGVEKIARQVDALERDPGSAIAYCDWMQSHHLPDGQRIDTVHPLVQQDDQLLRVLSGTWYPPHSYLIRRNAADRLQAEQAWWPARRICTDIEYTAIAALLGLRFLHVPGARVQYNKWGPTQLTTAPTPYSERVAAFQAIWERLGGIAARPAVAPRVSPVHRALLDLSWDTWAMPFGTVEIETAAPGRHRLHALATGQTFDAGPREATVATVLLAKSRGRPLLHHAMDIVETMPDLAHDVAGVFAALATFRRNGLLQRVAVRDDPPPAPRPTAPRPAAPRLAAPPTTHQPGTATRAVVAEAWHEALGPAGLAAGSRFDSAGGDSMALLTLALACEARLGVPVPLETLGVRMRPDDMAAALDRILAAEPGPGPQGGTADAALPTIFQIRVRHQMDLSEPTWRQACAGQARILSVALPPWPQFVQPQFSLSVLVDGIATEIDKRAGSAPVMLMGMCLGGFLAFLAAHRLVARGRRIGFLGIVDADAAWPEVGMPEELIDLFKARYKGPQFSGPVPRIARALGRRPRALRFLHATGWLRRLPPRHATSLNWHLNLDLPTHLNKAELGGMIAAAGVLDAPVTLFRTLEQPRNAPADLHWRRHAREVRVMPILGNHFSLFSPQYMPTVLNAFATAVGAAVAAVPAPAPAEPLLA